MFSRLERSFCLANNLLVTSRYLKNARSERKGLDIPVVIMFRHSIHWTSFSNQIEELCLRVSVILSSSSLSASGTIIETFVMSVSMKFRLTT